MCMCLRVSVYERESVCEHVCVFDHVCECEMYVRERNRDSERVCVRVSGYD
jgi:hypothetical protein